MKGIAIIIVLIFNFSQIIFAQKEKFYFEQSIKISGTKIIDSVTAFKIYNYFKNSNLFIWNDYNNCEDRANAVAILLDSWCIPNYKVWVFSGSFLEKDKGLLTDRYGVRWKYHVAACIPTIINSKTLYLMIDPSTTQDPLDASLWANNITDKQYSYYFLTNSNKYIWSGKGKNIDDNSFLERNTVNYEYTIQGLAGYNGLNRKDRKIMKSSEGKQKLKATAESFENLKNNKPFL